MTGHPHPYVMTRYAAQRHAEFHAEAERYRLTQLSAQSAAPRRPWTNLAAAVAAVVAVALSLAAGASVAEESSHLPRPGLHTDGNAGSPAPEEHLLDPSAVHALGAGRL